MTITADKKKDFWFAGLVVLVHLCFFLLACCFKRIYMGDSFEYIYEAVNIRSHWFFYSGNPAMQIIPEYMTQRQPVYPLFLAGLYCFDVSNWWVLVVQNGLSVFNILYIRKVIGKIGYEKRYDWLLLVLMVSYPSQFINANTVAPDILLQTFTVLYFGGFVRFVLSGLHAGGSRLFNPSGVGSGVAAGRGLHPRLFTFKPFRLAQFLGVHSEKSRLTSGVFPLFNPSGVGAGVVASRGLHPRLFTFKPFRLAQFLGVHFADHGLHPRLFSFKPFRLAQFWGVHSEKSRLTSGVFPVFNPSGVGSGVAAGRGFRPRLFAFKPFRLAQFFRVHFADHGLHPRLFSFKPFRLFTPDGFKSSNRSLWFMGLWLSLGLLTKPVLYPFAVVHVVVVVFSAWGVRGQWVKRLAISLIPLLVVFGYNYSNYTRTDKFHFSSNQSFNAVYYFYSYFQHRDGTESAQQFLISERQKIAAFPDFKDRFDYANARGFSLLRENFVPYMVYHLQNTARIFIEPGKAEIDLFTGKLTYGKLYSKKDEGFYASWQHGKVAGVIGYIGKNPAVPIVSVVLIMNLVRLWGVVLFFKNRTGDVRIRVFVVVLIGYFALAAGPIANTRYLIPVSLILTGIGCMGWVGREKPMRQ